MEAYTERRRSTRVDCDIKIGYTSNENFGSEFLRNLSMCGAFMETADPFVVGQPVRLTIPYTNGEQFAKINGTVNRIAEDGIGIEFANTL